MSKKWFDDGLIFPGVKAYIDRLAEGFNLPPAIVMQNLIIRRIAEEDATLSVYADGVQLFSEFTSHDGELVTGQELYDLIYSYEKDRLEKEYVKNLKAVPWEALTDNDKVILSRQGIFPKEYLKGQAEVQKEQKQNIDELREKFNLPKHEPGKNSAWEE